MKSVAGLLHFLVRQWSLVVAVCVGSGLSHAATSTMPFQVGALIDGSGISSGQAGLTASANMGLLVVHAFAPNLPGTR